jgi:hypothetical protein
MLDNSPAPSSSGIKFYILPLLVFTLLAICLYPFYKYRIISDDFSYLAIAQRYIRGDYHTAINGYWSPLNSWVLALFVEGTGLPLLPASYCINCCSFAALLLVSMRLSKAFVYGFFERMGLGLCMAVFWALNIPVTHFADAMNCTLLLICFSILTHKGFTTKPLLWILWGLTAAVAYFSKAYSFYILPLTLAIGLFILLKQEGRLRFKSWALLFGVSVGCLVLFSFPWLYLLHQKYGMWTLSTAGGVNTNWAIESHIYFSDSFKILVPPSNATALSCWEDPWMNHGILLSPLGSFHLLLQQLLRIAMNALNWFNVTAQFSPLYFWLLGLIALFNGKMKTVNSKWPLLIMAFLVFPAGYLMLSFGTRYLWFTVPLVMMLGLFIAAKYVKPYLKPKAYKVFLAVYFISWWPGAVKDLKEMFKEGKSEYEMAQVINSLPMHGSFLTNTYDNYQTGFRLSWYTGNAFYMHFGDNYSTKELLQEAHRQKVQYYYYFYQGASDDYQLLNANGKLYPEVSEGKLDGLKVFKLD